MNERWFSSVSTLVLVTVLVALFSGCSAEGADPADLRLDDRAGSDWAVDVDRGDIPGRDDIDSADLLLPSLPDSFPPGPENPGFVVVRPDVGSAPNASEVAAFTLGYLGFLERSNFLKWLNRHSQGLAPDNPWALPDYKIWWTNAFMVRSGDLVTLSWERPPDNTTQSVGRVLGAVAGMFLDSGDETAWELTLGLVRGLSATYDGMIWGDEDPVIEPIMARTIFNRSYETLLDGVRRLAVDYDSVRFEQVELRHDTVHNPSNPTWGDIYVRNKRSKDDFPFLYRNMAVLVNLAWKTEDDEIRDAIVKIVKQVRAMTADIIEHDYCIRTKDAGGKPYIPLTPGGGVEDYATFRSYDSFVPLGECTGKLATALLASGETLGNNCESADTQFYGDGSLYEELAIETHFCATDLIWGFHVAALAVALMVNDTGTARKLLDGLVARIDGLMLDQRAANHPEWWPEMAQLLVLAAAYGVPLTGAEARLVQTRYLEAFEFYEETVCWDPWDSSVPEGTRCSVMPDRYARDSRGNVAKAHVRIEEMLSPFEYCASPFRATTGASFIDCEALHK